MNPVFKRIGTVDLKDIDEEAEMMSDNSYNSEKSLPKATRRASATPSQIHTPLKSKMNMSAYLSKDKLPDGEGGEYEVSNKNWSATNTINNRSQKTETNPTTITLFSEMSSVSDKDNLNPNQTRNVNVLKDTS